MAIEEAGLRSAVEEVSPIDQSDRLPNEFPLQEVFIIIDGRHDEKVSKVGDDRRHVA